MNAPASEAASSTACARLDQVSKLFGAFAALRQVSVEFEPGRCYVLLAKTVRASQRCCAFLPACCGPASARSESSAQPKQVALNLMMPASASAT